MSQQPSPAPSLAADSSDDDSVDTRSIAGNCDDSENDAPFVYPVVAGGTVPIVNANNNVVVDVHGSDSEGDSSDDSAVAELPEISGMATYYTYLQAMNGVITTTPEQNSKLHAHELATAVDSVQPHSNGNTPIDVDAKQPVMYPFDTALAYTWRIPHFPLLRQRMASQQNRKFYSDTFTLCGHDWRIMVCIPPMSAGLQQ